MTITIHTNTFEEASKILRPTALTGVSSPYYTAACYCLEKEWFNEAITLLKKISKEHWQFDDAIKLTEDIYEKQISKLQEENLRLRAKLATVSLEFDNSNQPSNHYTLDGGLFSNFVNNLTNDPLPIVENQALTFSFPKQTEQKKPPLKNEIFIKPRKLHS